MDINSLQQINTFVGGMNTDTSDALLDSNQYRYAENLRIVTNTDSNTGELRVIEGTLEFIKNDVFGILGEKEILYLTSIRQYGVIILKVNNDWCIYRFEKDDEKPTLIFGPCGEPIWDENGANLSVVTRYESDGNIKMYIADGIHQIMCINIAQEPTDEEPITDFNYVSQYFRTSLPVLDVEVSSELSGQLTAAKVQYAYRLYHKNGGATSLSPLSKILSLYRDNNSGYAKGEMTGRAVEISIPNMEVKTYSTIKRVHPGMIIPQDGVTNPRLSDELSTSSEEVVSTDNYIQIYRITYVENGQEPKVDLIVDLKATFNTNIIDYGTSIISTISLSEFLSYIQTGIIPQHIELKNNYLFAANLKYDLDSIDKSFEKVRKNIEDYFSLRLSVEGQYKLDLNQQYVNNYSLDSTYRPGETYRIGIILYDNLGRKTSVFHLEDITISSDPFAGDNGMISFDENGYAYYAKTPALYVTLKKYIENCSKYEVVRCIRTIVDKRVITQGIIGRPLELFNGTSTNKIGPSGFISMNMYKTVRSTNGYLNIHGGKESLTAIPYCKPSDNILLFVSPEYVYLENDVKDIINNYKNLLTVEQVYDFKAKLDTNLTRLQFPASYHSTGSIITRTGSEVYEYKFTDHIPKVVSENEVYITNLLDDKTYDENYFNLLYADKPIYYAGHEVYSIKDVAYPDIPEWNGFVSGSEFTFRNDTTAIGNYIYYAWSNLYLTENSIVVNNFGQDINKTTDQIALDLYQSTFDRNHHTIGANVNGYARSQALMPTGYTGKCILIETSSGIKDKYNNRQSANQDDNLTTLDGMYTITVANLCKECTPYGGTSQMAKERSVYCSFGLIFNNKIGENKLTFGDCYLRLFKYTALHNWYESSFKGVPVKMSTVYCIPLFMDIDLRGEYGDFFELKDKKYYILNKASAFNEYVLNKDEYLYNTAYNQHPDIIQHSAYKEDEDTITYDTRVHYSNQKTNNERIDNWLQFKALNFLDVDSKYGEITDLKTFKDRLVFWQQHATGILSVNERVVLQDVNSTNIVLGTGNILDRYDYITTLYGMKSYQRASCASQDSLYWWDGYNKEILGYSLSSVIPLTLVNNIRNYINSGNESNNPHIYYDTKYKEVGCQCINNEVVVYNELLKKFTAVYTRRSSDMSLNRGFAPIYDAYIDNLLFLTDGKDIYESKQHSSGCSLLGYDVYPYIKYVVNTNNTLSKTYDILIIGGNLYGGSSLHTYDPNDLNLNPEKAKLFQNLPDVKSTIYWHKYHTNEPLESLLLRYTTPLKLEGIILYGEGITNREYDYRLNIPRQKGNNVYGGRLKGKTMQCELWSTSSSTDFSLQYITTKYRMSWS